MKVPSFSLFCMIFIWAQISDARSFNAQKYLFNPNLTYEFVESSNFYDPYLGFLYPRLFTFGVNYIDRPFVAKNTSDSSETRNILNHIQSYQFGYHSMLNFNSSLGMNFSVDQAQMDFDPTTQLAVSKNQTSFGDIQFNYKYRFFESSDWIISSKLNIGLGTGDKDYFLTDGNTISGTGIVERMFDSFRVSANLGYKYAPDAKFDLIDYSHRLQLALGGFWALTRTFGGTLELKRDIPLRPSIAAGSEIHLGFQKKMMNEGLTAFASVSTGSINNLTGKSNDKGSDYRLAFGFKWTPGFETANGHFVRSSDLSFDENSAYMKKYFPKNESINEVTNRSKIYARYNSSENEILTSDLKNNNLLKSKTNLVASNIDVPVKPITENQLKSNVVSNTLTEQEIQICKFYELVKVEFPIKIYFDFNKYKINSSETQQLDKAVSFINNYSDQFDYVKVEGHTDSRGPKNINKWISKMRAKAVTDYLKKNSLQTVKYQWFGLGSQQREVATAITAEQHAKNRRGEIRLEFVMKKNGLVCPGERGYENIQ